MMVHFFTMFNKLAAVLFLCRQLVLAHNFSRNPLCLQKRMVCPSTFLSKYSWACVLYIPYVNENSTLRFSSWHGFGQVFVCLTSGCFWRAKFFDSFSLMPRKEFFDRGFLCRVYIEVLQHVVFRVVVSHSKKVISWWAAPKRTNFVVLCNFLQS